MFRSNFLWFSLVVLAVMTTAGLGLSWMTYQSMKDELKGEMQIEAQRIENGFNSLLDEIRSLFIYVGKRIAKDNVEDPHVIWKHFQEILGKKDFRTPWDSPSYGWVTPDDRLIVTDIHGVLANDYDLSMRYYTQAAKLNPWIMHVDPPVISKPLNHWSIVGGFGIEDELGRYLGVIVFDLYLEYLNTHLEDLIINPNINFALFHENGTRVVHSNLDKSFYAIEPLFNQLAAHLQNPNQSYEMEDLEKLGVIIYGIHLERYPFIIATYFRTTALKKEWLNAFIPHILEVGGIGIFCLLIQYIFWKSISNKNRELDGTKKNYESMLALAKSSDSAKEDFLRSMNHEMLIPLTAIRNRIKTLLKHITQESDTEFVEEQEVHLLDEILEHALDFKNLTNHVLNVSEVKIGNILEECMTIHSKTAFEKGIRFSLHAEENLPLLLADELKIKQIFVSLLANAIKFSPPHEEISISVMKKVTNQESFIEIMIKDKGFWLSEETIKRLAEKFESINNNRNDEFEMSFDSIERLVQMHQGKCKVEHLQGKGTTFTLYFPLEKKNLSRNVNNILQFS